MNKRIIIAILCLTTSILTAQLTESFDDGNFTNNPTWVGDTDNFVVNGDLQLQLLAPDAGSSKLGLVTTFSDSIIWDLYFNMDFAPSSSNKLIITLWKDEITQDSYTLEIGETGSDDAFHFFANIGGSNTEIAAGTLGALGSDPAAARMRMSKSSDDFWTLSVSYNDNGPLSEDFMVMWPTPDLSGDHYFGFECSYSSTRTDKFFFDDIGINELLPDTAGPELLTYNLIDNQTILLCFDESIDPDEAVNASHYTLSNGEMPVEIDFDPANGSKVLLTFTPFQSGIDYTLTVNGIKDLSGNIGTSQMINFSVTESPSIGDLVINEILFDPYPSGEDFIEIYNNSTKTLNLNGLIIVNTQKDDDDIIDTDIILKPDSYIAFTPDVPFLKDNYTLDDEDTVVDQDIPSFNNDSGNVSLRILENSKLITLDSMDYDEDMHYILLDDTEGVSLERINPNVASNIRDNWQSASEVSGYATPGYRNSNFITMDAFTENFNIAKSTFSPNGDGDGDVLIVSYSLDGPSYLANAKIFDAQGRIIKELLNNTLLSTEGFVKWDGTTDENTLASVGIYVIWFEIFNPDGMVSQFKKTVVLADFLN